MSNGYVSVTDFKKLEQKVNRLLVIHELDSMLTPEEKQLVSQAKTDINFKKKGVFVGVDGL